MSGCTNGEMVIGWIDSINKEYLNNAAIGIYSVVNYCCAISP